MFKILIVDPNVPFRRSLKKVLIGGFPFIDIREASDERGASAIVQYFSPDLVFLEMHLPAGNGLDLARRLKSTHPDIIIVILTSYNLPEYQSAAAESGIAHLVPKDDWTGKDIMDLVHAILSDLDIKVPNSADRHHPQQYTPQTS
jgi:CheY-like chemotaxis protein